MEIKAESFKQAEEGKKYIRLERAADGDTFNASDSGKAICLMSKYAACNKVFWFPVSILRRSKNANPCFGSDLLVPVWFIYNNNLQQHFGN